jgi:methionyl-tRNA formyltransferase
MNSVLTNLERDLIDRFDKQRVRFFQVLKEIDKELPDLPKDERLALAIRRMEEKGECFIVIRTKESSISNLMRHFQKLPHLVESIDGDKYRYKIYPNTDCLNENHAKYPGQYVALENYVVVASGKTIEEAYENRAAYENQKHRKVKSPYLHYIIKD